MRHRKKFNHLSRKSAHRKAMFANMASSLILHKKIKTTTAKAKALRIFIEPLITKAKYTFTSKTKVEEATHLRRIVFSYLKQKEAVTELFTEVAPKVVNRNGGYTRILKTGKRLGDNAEMCFIELVDFNENMLKTKDTATKKEDTKKKTTRRGRRGKNSTKPEAPKIEEKVAMEKVKDNTKKEVKIKNEKQKTSPKSKAPTKEKSKNTKKEDKKK